MVKKLLVVLAGLLLNTAAAAQCPLEWVPGFHAPGVSSLAGEGEVSALAVFDPPGPEGPALYAAGDFMSAGDAVAWNIARWDGNAWAALTSDRPSIIYALAVFDDGGGPALYAGGQGFWMETPEGLAIGVGRWDGAVWSPVGSNPPCGGHVYAFAVYDDGTGPALYAGGDFEHLCGGEAAHRIAKWDGTTWSDVGAGVDLYSGPAAVYALAVYDDGTGPALYAGGQFSEAGGIVASNIARWDGVAWSDAEVGVGCFYLPSVNALAVYDPPGVEGAVLYAGGDFRCAGSVWASAIARWDGVAWSDVGGGMSDPDNVAWVRALSVYNDGSGEALYAGGWFESAGGTLVHHLARWDGVAWTALGDGLPDFGTSWPVNALATYSPPGEAAKLYIGGGFPTADGVAANRIAAWDGSAFTALGDGQGLGDAVWALCTYDDGTGPAVYAGGEFHTAGEVAVSHIARWDGEGWSSLNGGLESGVIAMTVFDPPGPELGPGLYVGNSVLTEVEEAFIVERWDAQSWSIVGDPLPGWITALAVHDEGAGPALYAVAGDPSGDTIWKWDGQIWSLIGTVGGGYGSVNALCSFAPAGGVAELYAGGDFRSINGQPARSLAKWDGVAWTEADGGRARVTGMALYDFPGPGGAPALYVGDDNGVWDGANWHPMPGGLDGAAFRAFGVVDEEAGPVLYAIGMVPSDFYYGVGRWDGTAWSFYTVSLPGVTTCVTGLREESGVGIYVGGFFTQAGETASSNVAKLTCLSQLRIGDLNCDGVVDGFDIDPFVAALVSPEQYTEGHPDCFLEAADCNSDGRGDVFDVDPFVDILLGQTKRR
jgi:trimeric autotransporter adhesin